MIINLQGKNKAKVLAALYNNSKPLGMGFLYYNSSPMTEIEAEEILKNQTYFDYLKGRVMKVDLSGESFNSRLYDRDNGEGSAEQALRNL